MNKYWPIATFIVFAVILICALFYYAPSWGLMDDWQNLTYAESAWKSPAPLSGLCSAIKAQFNVDQEYYRPLYFTWVLFAYHFFKASPLMLYFLILLFNLCSLLLWGIFLDMSVNRRGRASLAYIFIFPLSFFIFTPFWNIFMYISLQEKFVIFFGIISFIFLKKALDSTKISYLFISVFSALCALLSKPTGIYLIFLFIVFCFSAIVFFKKKNSITVGGLLSYSAIFGIYYFITMKFQCKGYTAKYGSHLSLSGFLANLTAAPGIIKVLFFFGCLFLLYVFFRLLSGKSKLDISYLLVPLGFVSYLLILIPWGIHNYHLSIAAPYLLGMAFPLYVYLCGKSSGIRGAVNLLLLSTVALCLIYVIIPRISKMSDIKKAMQFISDFKPQGKIAYFFPPPYSESAIAIGNFTGKKVYFLDNGILKNDMLRGGAENYLIYRDEGTDIILKNIRIDTEVYSNRTWRIYSLAAQDNYESKFKPVFAENLFTKVKLYLLKK